MYKTEHYNLNQWDKSDRIMMEDFNRDNASIDAALAGHAAAMAAAETARIAGDTALQTLVATKSAFEPLFSFTTTERAEAVEVDCAGINFADYFYIILQATMVGVSPFRAHLNTLGNGSCYAGSSDMQGFGTVRPGDYSLNHLLPIHKQGGSGAFGVFSSPNMMGSCTCPGITWSQVKKLIWAPSYASYTFLTGCKVSAWGVK